MPLSSSLRNKTFIKRKASFIAIKKEERGKEKEGIVSFSLSLINGFICSIYCVVAAVLEELVIKAFKYAQLYVAGYVL